MARKTTTTASVRRLSTDEAAVELGVSPSTLRTWRHERRGPESYKLGGKVVYDSDKVEAYREQERARTLRGGGAR